MLGHKESSKVSQWINYNLLGGQQYFSICGQVYFNMLQGTLSRGHKWLKVIYVIDVFLGEDHCHNSFHSSRRRQDNAFR